MKTNNDFVKDAVYNSMQDIWALIGSSAWFLVGDVVWEHINLSLVKPMVFFSVEQTILDLNENRRNCL